MTDSQLVTYVPFIPLVGAFLIWLGGHRPNVREGITMVTAGLLLIGVLAIAPAVMAGERPSASLYEIFPGLEIAFQVEPLGMLFALIASFLWIPNSLYSIGYMRAHDEPHQTRYYTCFAIALFSAVGMAFAANMLTLFLFYELLTISTYPLVTHSGTPEAKRSGRIYLGILLGTSIGLQLLALIATYVLTGTLDFREGGILAGFVEPEIAGVLLFLYMFGIGKAALMPFHRWLPAAMVAPTPVSALLHAVAVVKGGVFTVVKVIVYIFGLDFINDSVASGWLVAVSGATIILASLVALQQDNLKRRLAYSTISQLSYVVMAAAVIAPAAVMGSVIHIAAHAFGKITLFFAAGSIFIASHKTLISQLGGIGRRMPWTMTAFAVGTISMIGLPPAAGFISKWYMLTGALDYQVWAAVSVIVLSTLLNAAYFVPVVYAAFFGEENSPAHSTVGAAHVDHDHVIEDHGEAPIQMVVAQSITAAGTIILFLYPQPVIHLAQMVVGVNP